MANKVTAVANGSNDANFVGLPNNILDVYSQEIRFAAQPRLMFESVCVKKEDLMVNPGGTIRFLRYNALTGGSVIAEDQVIETEALTNSTFAITVDEHARAIGVSQKQLMQSITDTLADASTVLGANYAKNRDVVCRDAALTVSTTMYGNSVANRQAIVGGSTLNVALIQDAVEQLATNKAPKIGGDAYVCFVHPRQSKFLRRDSAWINVVQYGDPSRIFNGEIGRIEDVRFIETTQIQVIKMNASQASTVSNVWSDNAQETLRNGAGAFVNRTVAIGAGNVNTDVYRAVLLGENAVGLADALNVEMRDNGVQDYGRKHALAYYAVFGAGTIEPGHGIVLETA